MQHVQIKYSPALLTAGTARCQKRGPVAEESSSHVKYLDKYFSASIIVDWMITVSR